MLDQFALKSWRIRYMIVVNHTLANKYFRLIIKYSQYIYTNFFETKHDMKFSKECQAQFMMLDKINEEPCNSTLFSVADFLFLFSLPLLSLLYTNQTSLGNLGVHKTHQHGHLPRSKIRLPWHSCVTTHFTSAVRQADHPNSLHCRSK